MPGAPAPPGGPAAGAGADPAPAPTPGTCGPAVDEAVGLANRGETADARRLLEEATARCPGEAAGWRELAGLDALGKDWPRAAVNARRALTADRGDQHAARILATSLFLEADTIGALRAWNHVGEPTLDLVEVRGLERTRMAVAMHALRLAAADPADALVPDACRTAARRAAGADGITRQLYAKGRRAGAGDGGSGRTADAAGEHARRCRRRGASWHGPRGPCECGEPDRRRRAVAGGVALVGEPARARCSVSRCRRRSAASGRCRS